MIVSIDSLDHPELEPYRTLRRAQEHWKQGIFVAEGEKVVRRLLASGLQTVSFLMTPAWQQRLSASLPPAAPVYVGPQRLLEQIVGFPLHQGIMAVAHVPQEPDFQALANAQPHFLVALDGLVSAENVGVIIRNCAAFGVDAALVAPGSSSPYLRRAVRNSMGAVFSLPILHLAGLTDAFRTLRDQYGTRIVAAYPDSDRLIRDSELTGNLCIVFGNEDEGVSQETLEWCTHRIAIPMQKNTDSLNVSSAAAVFLYEAARQRTPAAQEATKH